jgi:hypothetical protein
LLSVLDTHTRLGGRRAGAVFASMEITFRESDQPDAPVRTHRHDHPEVSDASGIRPSHGPERNAQGIRRAVEASPEPPDDPASARGEHAVTY